MENVIKELELTELKLEEIENGMQVNALKKNLEHTSSLIWPKIGSVANLFRKVKVNAY